MLTSTIEDLSKSIGRWLSKSHNQLDAEQSIKDQRLFVKYERELLRCGRDIQSLPRFANAQVVAFRKIIKKYKVTVLHPRLIAPLGSNSMDTEMDRLDNPRFPLQQEHLVRPSEFHKMRLHSSPKPIRRNLFNSPRLYAHYERTQLSRIPRAALYLRYTKT